MPEAQPEKKAEESQAGVWAWLQHWAWDEGWFIVIPLAVAVFAIWLVWEPPPASAESPHIFYLLSALAQSLAAVLALIITISLIVAQLSSRYSHRMLASFFRPYIVVYLFVFIAAVFYSFRVLADPDPWRVKVSLTLAATCLFPLVPYFLSFKRKLNPEVMLQDLKKNASEQLKASSEKEPAEISTIHNTVMNAFAFKDYDTFNTGVELLADLALEAYEREKKDIGSAIASRLRDIGLGTIEDPRAPWQVVLGLGEFGRKAAEQRLGDAASFAADSLGGIGIEAAGKGLSSGALGATVFLSRIGTKAAEKGLGDAAERAAISLGGVGLKVAEKGMDEAAKWAVHFLGTIGTKAAEKGLRNAAEWAAHSLGRVGTKAAEKGLDEAATQAARFLWTLGAWTTFTENRELRQRVVDNLRSIEGRAGAKLLQTAFKDAEKSLSQDPQELREALWEFQRKYFPE